MAQKVVKSYRALANIITSGDSPNYVRDKVYTEPEFKKVPKDKQHKFQEIEAVYITDSEDDKPEDEKKVEKPKGKAITTKTGGQ